MSLSARIFAQSARRGGWTPLIIDQFNDSDTVSASEHAYRIDFNNLNLHRGTLDSALKHLLKAGKNVGIVYGSGADYRLKLIERFAHDSTVYGNSVETLRSCYDPKIFFSLLERLAIPHPDTQFTVPKSTTGWLMKVRSSEGGREVRLVDGNSEKSPAIFFQRFLPGPVMTALFLADHERFGLVGFNTQTHSRHDARRPFIFAGLINRTTLSESQKNDVATYIGRLVQAIKLTGLNSLDFILTNDGCRIIELNPRPSASVALYDEDYPEGLIHAHVRACQGTIDVEPLTNRPVRAFKIFYTPTTISIPPTLKWPRWCADRPFPGTTILPGEPLCTITMRGCNRKSVESGIQQREKQLMELFALSKGMR